MKTRGFTLIELLTVLAVVTIMVVMAAPAFAEFFDRGRLRGAADEFVSVLAKARGEAVRLNRDVRVDFGGSTTSWCVGANSALDPASPGDLIPAVTACDCTDATQCLVAGVRTTASNTSFAGVTTDKVTGAFIYDRSLGTQHQTGSDSPATAVANLTSPSGRYGVTITVSPLGQARTCSTVGKPSMPGYPGC